MCARIFAVTYTFTPCSCAKAMPSFISSIEKFFALARKPNASPPMYTASAPNTTAVFNTSRLLAGINNSGCLIILFLSLFFFSSAFSGLTLASTGEFFISFCFLSNIYNLTAVFFCAVLPQIPAASVLPAVIFLTFPATQSLPSASLSPLLRPRPVRSM